MHQTPPNPSSSAPNQRYTLQFERFSAFVEEYTSLLSLGGMFLKTEEPSPVGSIIAFDVKLTDGYRLFQGSGEVVWIRYRTVGPGQESGVGVRFQALDESGRELILKILEEQVKGGGEPFDVDEVPPDGVDEMGTASLGVPETGAPETGLLETGVPGTGVPDTGVPETGVPETGVPEIPHPVDGALLSVAPSGSDPIGDFSEEATLVTQRENLGLGPSQGLDFSSPWEKLPEDVPSGLLDAGTDALSQEEPQPPELTEDITLVGSVRAAPAMPSVSSETPAETAASSEAPELESPFAMGDTDFGEFDDLPDLDAGDDLVLESETEVQFDRTVVGPVGTTSEQPAVAAEGVEFETGPEMALELDDGALPSGASPLGERPIDQPVSPFPTANLEPPGFEPPDLAVNDEPLGSETFGSEPPADPTPTPSLLEGSATAPWPATPGAATPEPDAQAAVDSASAPASSMGTSGEPATGGAGADYMAGLGGVDSDPFATHSPPNLQPPSPSSYSPPTFDEEAMDSVPSDASFGAHDATENLTAVPAIEAPWSGPPDMASLEGAAFGSDASFGVEASAASEATAEVDMSEVVQASPYGMQDYDLEAAPATSGMKATLGKSRWLLVSLVLVLLMAVGFLQRHRLGGWLGIDAADGNATPTVVSLPGQESSDPTDSAPETFSDDGDSVVNANSGADSASDGFASDGFQQVDETVDTRGEVAGSEPRTVDVQGQFPSADVMVSAGSAAPASDPATTSSSGTSTMPPPAAPARRQTAASTGRRATRVVSISARRTSGGTEVVVELDGRLDAADVIYDALGYNPQREQIRLVGIDLPFEHGTVAVGTSEIVQVRTGLHAAPSGESELRLVFDLAAGGFSAGDYRLSGDRLEISVR